MSNLKILGLITAQEIVSINTHLRNRPRKSPKTNFIPKNPWKSDHFDIIHNDFKRSTNWAIFNHGRFIKVKNSKIPRIKTKNFAQNRPEWGFDETIDR